MIRTWTYLSLRSHTMHSVCACRQTQDMRTGELLPRISSKVCDRCDQPARSHSHSCYLGFQSLYIQLHLLSRHPSFITSDKLSSWFPHSLVINCETTDKTWYWRWTRKAVWFWSWTNRTFTFLKNAEPYKRIHIHAWKNICSFHCKHLLIFPDGNFSSMQCGHVCKVCTCSRHVLHCSWAA